MEPIQILRPDGGLTGESPLAVAEVQRLFRAMVSTRAYDHKATAMQKQGRLATYAPFEGQEAAQIGAVAALEERDWVVGTYRDAAAMWFHGYPWVNLILGRTGDERGGAVPDGVNVMPPSITVGAHMIHAVGLGWASRLQGSDAIAMTFFGDGATSEGDFHEAMNFAGVYSAPVVFVCQNNGWAISTPTSRQTASETIAQKATAYGMPGIRVDGNDLLAMYQVSRDAVARARAGEGPTLIEAMTYRIGPHTTTDDPGRYRDEAESDEWRLRDPVDRVRTYLESAGALEPGWEADVQATEADAVERAVSDAEALEPFGPDEIFSAMYAEPTVQLDDQMRSLTE